MNWMDQLGGLLQQYANQNEQDARGSEEDFDQVAQHAPKQDISQGLAGAFRSQHTPPFPNMLGQLFNQSNPDQRASILNTLLQTAGPALIGGAAGGGLGALLGPLTGMLSSGQQQITPDVAARVPPQAVEQIAAQAERQDPTIVDRVSDFYADNPTLVKGLGAAALGIALNHLAKQKRGGLF